MFNIEILNIRLSICSSVSLLRTSRGIRTQLIFFGWSKKADLYSVEAASTYVTGPEHSSRWVQGTQPFGCKPKLFVTQRQWTLSSCSFSPLRSVSSILQSKFYTLKDFKWCMLYICTYTTEREV